MFVCGVWKAGCLQGLKTKNSAAFCYPPPPMHDEKLVEIGGIRRITNWGQKLFTFQGFFKEIKEGFCDWILRAFVRASQRLGWGLSGPWMGLGWGPFGPFWALDGPWMGAFRAFLGLGWGPFWALDGGLSGPWMGAFLGLG
jgi:hypothetical protein